MRRRAKGRWPPAVDRVTAVARAASRSIGELAAVRVGVAVRAAPRRQTDRHHRAGGSARVARGTRNRRMAPGQRKRGRSMLVDGECRRREPIDAMTRRAVHGLARDRRPAVVWVAMTRSTGREGRTRDGARRAGAVTRRARHVGMTTTQWITGAIVIERSTVDGLEAGRHVTSRARAGDAPLVRAGMTRRTVLERHGPKHGRWFARRVERRAESCSQVTFRACHVAVLAGQRILRLRMIEPGRIFPSSRVVTARARASERAAMRVGVTARAIPLEAHPAGGRASWRQRRGGRHAQLRGMTRRAFRGRVALLQRVARAAGVIEALRRAPWPLNELKLAPRMIRVTARACALTRTPSVKTAAVLAEPRDLPVTR